MSDFGTMKARVASEMKRGDMTACATAVQSAVLTAIEYYGKRATWFNEFRQESLQTTSGEEYLTLSASLRPVRFTSVKVRIDATRDYPLSSTTFQEIDRVDASQYIGYPELYAYYDGTLRLYPIPNGTYTMLLAGVRHIPGISAGASTAATNEWLTDCEEIIRCRAKGYLYRDEVHNPQRAEYFFQEAEKAWRELSRQNTGLRSSGRVRSRFW